jgi:hypothetical protein
MILFTTLHRDRYLAFHVNTILFDACDICAHLCTSVHAVRSVRAVRPVHICARCEMCSSLLMHHGPTWMVIQNLVSCDKEDLINTKQQTPH